MSEALFYYEKIQQSCILKKVGSIGNLHAAWMCLEFSLWEIVLNLMLPTSAWNQRRVSILAYEVNQITLGK